MPVYNRQEFLPETLSSIAAQTYTNWELLAVDDGSTDTSKQIIQEFSERFPGKVRIIFSNQSQSGAANCRNLGINHAFGDLIIFLDSDDKLAPHCLEQRKIVMQNITFDWAVFLQYVWIPGDLNSNRVFNKLTKTKQQAIAFFLQMDPAWQTMAPIWRLDTLKKLQGFDKSLIYMEDPDLHLRALLDNSLQVSFCYNLPPDCYYRVDNSDATKANRFYDLSITSRFLFLNKIDIYLSKVIDENIIMEYKSNLRKGYIAFLKVFLLSRIKKFYPDFTASLSALAQKKILSNSDVKKIKLMAAVYYNDSVLINKLRLKGLLYRFIH